jgi:hypothetical protein
MSRRVDKNDAAIKHALALVSEALDLLDAHGGPVDAAAHLNMAQARIRQALQESSGPSTGSDSPE